MASEERVRRAAVELFAERGFHGTGIRDLASAAGLSSASLYHYMGTKEDLLLDIMRSNLEVMVRAAEQVCERHADPAEQLSALVRMHVRAHAERPLETRVVDGELRALTAEGRVEMTALRDRYESSWVDAMQAGVAAGVVRVPDVRLARLALIEMCSSVSRWYSAAGTFTVDEVAAHFTVLAAALLGLEPIRAADVGGDGDQRLAYVDGPRSTTQTTPKVFMNGE